ncbi:hypothetical protein CPARA_3gp384 (nucleomorph) [Cryptomonas paramecium]|uniref:Uncharacterized protein n=1 Tax=Cryptomonas paramaecium TaxID=2898 RepID=F2HIB8_9CRYP|nr:hypothetical protein CPARA_3gp384 [Cryptomonas paramecium]AEA39042.1 hypothetical protein CPARA_3gp384 [Cryptomonas paramecium]
MCRVVCILKNFSLYSNLYQKAREPLGDRLDVNINYTRYKKKNIKILYVKYKKKFISFFLSLFLKNTYLIEAIDQVGHELNIESIINKNSEYICEKFVLSFFDFILHENIILKKNKNIQFGIICKEKKYLSSKILNYTCNFYNIMKYLPCKKNVYVINNHRQHLFFSKTSYKTIKFFNKFTHSKVFFFSFPNKFLFLKKIKCLLSLGNFLFLKFFSKKNKTLFAIISGFFLLLNFIGKQLIPVRMNIILVNLKHIISKKKANFSRYFKVKRSSAFFLLFENLLFKNVKSSRHMFFFLFSFFQI